MSMETLNRRHGVPAVCIDVPILAYQVLVRRVKKGRYDRS